MSGIAGIVRFDGAPIEPGLVEKMTGAMAHRGPDGINHWVRGSVALGQCMLRTTPESLEENQPLTNEDETLVLVMDGRVDNWEELRRELLGCGAVLRNRSDAELVLKAYDVWGVECPDRIIGEFVFFIWDARQRRLFAARDAAGTRFFHYHAGNGWFGFASEIKGLLALDLIEPRLNESRLLEYLAVQFARDDEVDTFYQGISRMPAGHAMWATERGAKAWRYWDPRNLHAMSFGSLAECTEGFVGQLHVAVKSRLRSIGPVGAMLSGGLDSSSIVGLIRKEFRNNLPQPLQTFSLIRQDRENCPDWQNIEIMLKDGWVEPTIISSAMAGNVCRSYSDSIQYFDEPFALSHGFPDSVVFEAARRDGCGIVLDGMAGDLLFYTPQHSLECVLRRKMFSQIPVILDAYQRHGIKNGLWALAWMCLRGAVPQPMRAAYRKLRDNRKIAGGKLNEVPGDLLQLLHGENARQFVAKKLAQREQTEGHVKLGDDQDIHARIFGSGTLSFAHEVVGQIALSKGVEPRSPFSDRRLIEFAIQMPLEGKLSAPWYKQLLRDSMVGILPEDVRWRRQIRGNPGWKFYERLISEMAKNAPDVWNLEHVSDSLASWIDTAKLGQAWSDYDRSAEFATGFNLFTLAMLAQWITSRHQSFQLSG